MEENNPYSHLSQEGVKHSDGSQWKAKHAFARVFYATFRDQMMELWKKINGEKELRPAIWTNFVESPELWNMVYNKLMTMSNITIHMCAYNELVEEGMDAISEERETYFLVPLMLAMTPVTAGEGVLETVETEGKKCYACQQLLKTMLIYFLADIYGKKIIVYFMSHESLEVDRNTIMKPLFLKRRDNKKSK